MTKLTPEQVEKLEADLQGTMIQSHSTAYLAFVAKHSDTILTLCREWREQQQVLADCDNAMTDYIVTLEKQGGMMGYGRSVLKRVRVLIPNPITEAP